MRRTFVMSITLLIAFVTQSVSTSPASAKAVAPTRAIATATVAASGLMNFGGQKASMSGLSYTRALSTSATFVAAPTNVRAVPGNPAHSIDISFTDNSDNESGFEIWNGNDPSVGDPAASLQGASPSPGTGSTVTRNWWMPQANSWMCVRVRAYNDDNPRSYSAWAPANGWACSYSS
jgi:hypothetical protein